MKVAAFRSFDRPLVPALKTRFLTISCRCSMARPPCSLHLLLSLLPPSSSSSLSRRRDGNRQKFFHYSNLISEAKVVTNFCGSLTAAGMPQNGRLDGGRRDRCQWFKSSHRRILEQQFFCGLSVIWVRRFL